MLAYKYQSFAEYEQNMFVLIFMFYFNHFYIFAAKQVLQFVK